MSTASSAKIHDLGYKRYEGPRSPQAQRYRSIVKNVPLSAWSGFWRMKAWVISGVITIVVLGAFIYFAGNTTFGLFVRTSGAPVTMGEAFLPYSFQFLRWISFALTLSVVASIVANDLRTGAFEFYFSRPVRPIDYVMGKLGGAIVVVAPVLLLMPLLLTIFRVALIGPDQIVSSLILIPKMILVGTIATIAYAAVPLAFSAVASRSRYTLPAWAAFYIIVGWTLVFIGMRTGIPALTALHLPTAVDGIAFALFDVTFRFQDGNASPPMWAALVTLTGYVLLSLAVVYWRVRTAERAGMGGG